MEVTGFVQTEVLKDLNDTSVYQKVGAAQIRLSKYPPVGKHWMTTGRGFSKTRSSSTKTP